MSVERHLILQELVLRPSGEWNPRNKGWIIARVAEGAGYWLQGGNARELNAGDGFVAVPQSGTDVRVRASQLGEMKLQFFIVQPQYLAGVLTVVEWRRLEATPEHPHNVIFTALESLGQRFTRMVNQSHADELPVRCALLQLWATAAATVLAMPAPMPAGNSHLRERFRHLLGQMPETELAGHPLGELARQLHCSERHFSRLFREEFGVPLRTRQIELRLQRARQLLADSDDKVINVAYESGFRHLGLFNAMFKKRFGLAPGEWRRQNMEKTSPARPGNLLPRPLSGGVQILLALLGIFFGWSAFAQTNAAPDAGATERARAALLEKMAELDAQDRVRAAGVHIVTAPTNSGRRFQVDRYLVEGNSILTPAAVGHLFTNVPAAFGTNVFLDAVLAAAGDLQTAYRERGFMTVKVSLPPQKLTNDEIRVQVTEGRLVAINVGGDEWRHYYSSNNVMRALPDLRTNILLNAKIFQRELDAANMSRDRQIYPVIGPGPDPGTSELMLNVKDCLPLHMRLEVNNQATPGTPDFRAAFSAQYDNLWGREHQVGLQYNLSFNQYKNGSDYNWTPFDTPQVANYSGYYRLPLGGYQSVQEQVDARPGSFGYNEATHQFTLPPATGRPELTFFASRAVSDTGVQRGPLGFTIPPQPFTNNGVLFTPISLSTNSAGKNITLNEDLGLKLNLPLPQIGKVSATLFLGADFKRFQQTSYNTNENNFVIQYPDQQQNIQTITSYVPQPLATTYTALNYFPLNAGISGSVADKLGTTFFNSQVNFNVLPGFSGDGDFAKVSYAGTNAHANYVTLQLGADRVQSLYKDWSVKLHADGQWADTPLIGNEQFAMGGVSGVRGYIDGEAYGDTGWRLTIEPQLPPMDLGMIGNLGAEAPCWLRGSVFMDYGKTDLLHASPGTGSGEKFWGVGWAAAINLGSHLGGRVTMAWPLTATALTRVGVPHIYFGVGAQF